MDIIKKIEFIRSQPREIRMKWVWGCVIVSMALILILWVFSIASMFAENKNSSGQQEANSDVQDLKQQLQGMQSQVSSIKDLGNQMPSTENAAENNSQNANTDFNVPQSSIYSTLGAGADNTSQ
jgi:type II secretory pathway pseudopilin PulG